MILGIGGAVFGALQLLAGIVGGQFCELWPDRIARLALGAAVGAAAVGALL